MKNTRKPIQSKENQYYSSAEKEEDVDTMCPPHPANISLKCTWYRRHTSWTQRTVAGYAPSF